MASHKYLPNGRIQIIITRGTDVRGKPKRYYKTIDACSKRQLAEEDALFLAEIMRRGTVAGTNATVEQLFNDFLANHCRDLKISSVGRYKTLYANQIRPYFGKRRVKDITRVDIRDWVEDLLTNAPNPHRPSAPKGLAPKTVKNALGLFKGLFNYAIDELEIVEKNPCQRVRVRQRAARDNVTALPGVQRHRQTAKALYTEDECLALIRALMDALKTGYTAQRHATLLLLILFTGLRTSEVMGLRWDDIDLASRTLTVERERIYVSGEGVFMDSTKSTSSERVLSLPAFVTELLRELRDEQKRHRRTLGRDYTPSGYVAVLEDGRPQYPRQTYAWFKRFLQKHNFRDCSVHDLRHTHAAMLSRLDVQIIDVSHRLGHSNTRVTQEVYEYLFQNVDDQVSGRLDEYIREKTKL